MKRQPIGYLPLCQILLDHGVSSQAIIKHRFILQAMAACMYAGPIDVDHDQLGFTFLIENKGRSFHGRVRCSFYALSGTATVQREEKLRQTDTTWAQWPERRLSMVSAPAEMLWLFPIEDDFTIWERFRIWVERCWLKITGRSQ